MNDPQKSPAIHEPSAVDDVRRIRARFDRESHGDLRKHVAESQRIAGQWREKLGLKIVKSHTAAAVMPSHPD